MRRPLALTVGLLLLLGIAPADAQDAGGGGGHVRLAMADWHPVIKGKRWWYVAGGLYAVDPVSGIVDQSFMFVGRGKCSTTRGENVIITACSATGPGAEIPNEQFSFDFPGMESAHAEMRLGRYRHTVDWTGSGGETLPYASADGPSAGAGVSGIAPAVATGRVYGKRLRPNREPFSFTILVHDTGAGAGLAQALAAHGVTLHPDGRFEIRRVYRVPVRRGAA